MGYLADLKQQGKKDDVTHAPCVLVHWDWEVPSSFIHSAIHLSFPLSVPTMWQILRKWDGFRSRYFCKKLSFLTVILFYIFCGVHLFLMTYHCKMPKIPKSWIFPWEYAQQFFRGAELSLNTYKNSKGWAGEFTFRTKQKTWTKCIVEWESGLSVNTVLSQIRQIFKIELKSEEIAQ